MQPFFSLILPCYKVAAYVERCVRSILEQDFTDYEVILVDDGSPDETSAICDCLAEKHAGIRVIHKENGGLASARNAGMASAVGRYIWFIDSDDWIEPGALKMLHQACTEEAPEVIKFRHYRVEGERVYEAAGIPAALHKGKQLDELRKTALCESGRYCLSAWSHVYRRDFLKKHGFEFVSERIICSEDYLFNLQVLMQTSCIRVLSEPLYRYELRMGSLTQLYKADLVQRYIELHRQLKAYIQSAGLSGQYDGLLERFFLWHLVVGTCFTHEYFTTTDAHTIQHARKSVCGILSRPEVQYAVRTSDRTGLRWQKKVQLMAMRLKQEWLFYWLYVKKPSARK